MGLQIYFYPHQERPTLRNISAVNALIHHTIADAELRVITCVMGESEEILRLCPYADALKPRLPAFRHRQLPVYTDILHTKL